MNVPSLLLMALMESDGAFSYNTYFGNFGMPYFIDIKDRGP